MPHMPRQHLALRQLLHVQRVAALGSLNADSTPMVSMVPFAIDPLAPCLVIHVSSLAAHTGNMLRHPDVSLLVMQAEVAGEPVHALPRATLTAQAHMPTPESPPWHQAREAYLARFPEAAPMMELGDFRLVRIQVTQLRQIAGFGAARSLDSQEITQLLTALPQ